MARALQNELRMARGNEVAMMTPVTPFTSFAPSGARDEDALLREIAPRIARVVRAVLGHAHADVEDVTQQATFAFVQALPSFRGECEPARFAARIAARTAIAAAQQARTLRARLDAEIEIDALEDVSRAPDADLARTRRVDAVRALLARIPPEQAETMVLRVMLSWTLPEVAAATGVPLNTVRSRVRLAKNALRAALEADPALAEELGG